MNNPTWIIAKKELASYFDSLVAYIMLVLFLGLTGFFTWLFGMDVFIRKQADLSAFFSIAQIALLIFIPAITMKMIAEEKKTGTIELLLTKAVSDRQVVWGKFLACLMLVIIALLFTLPYYISISMLGDIDHGASLCGYLGLILLSAAFIGIGLLASSISSNQIVAFLLALFAGIIMWWIFDLIASTSTGVIGDLFSTLSLRSHYESLARGVIDSKDIIYFLSIAGLGVLLTEVVISKR